MYNPQYRFKKVTAVTKKKDISIEQHELAVDVKDCFYQVQKIVTSPICINPWSAITPKLKKHNRDYVPNKMKNINIATLEKKSLLLASRGSATCLFSFSSSLPG